MTSSINMTSATTVGDYSNFSHPHSFQQPHRLERIFLALIIYGGGTSMAVTLVGNVLVCLCVLLVRKLRQPSNFLLFSLALTDLGVGVIVEPLNLIYEINARRWSLGTAMCRVYTSSDLTLCTASILTLCAISVDRYLAITRPFTYCPKRTKCRCLVYVLIVWLSALLISVSPLIFLEQEKLEPNFMCQIPQNVHYQIYAMLGSFYLPACTILVVNYKIMRAARRLSLLDRRNYEHHSPCGSYYRNNQRASTASRYQAASDASKPIAKSAATVSKNSRKAISVVEMKTRKSGGTSPDASGGGKNHLMPINRTLSERSDAVYEENHNFLLSGKWSSIKSRLSQMSAFPSYSRKESRWSSQKRVLESETKAMKTLGVITGAFLVCWLPFFGLALIRTICPWDLEVPHWLDMLLIWLGYVNSALNPFIYAKYNKDFRVPLREMLCCRFSTLQETMRREEFVENFGLNDPVAVVPVPGSKGVPLRRTSPSMTVVQANRSAAINGQQHDRSPFLAASATQHEQL